MPLLKKVQFTPKAPPKDLQPDEEVYLCPTTMEVFRDYEEFFQRVILCNSLVWSCSLTGKSDLTYEEAVVSERRALEQIQSFPLTLQRPILYLCSLTHRTRLSALEDDIFGFVKDRYFIDEVIDVVVGGVKMPAKVVRVIPPPPSEAPKKPSKDEDDPIVLGDSDDEEKTPTSVPNGGSKEESSSESDEEFDEVYRYQYEVEEVETHVRRTLNWDCLSRKKGLFTRDKCKLCIKQHCELKEGIWKLKRSEVKQRPKKPSVEKSVGDLREEKLIERDKRAKKAKDKASKNDKLGSASTEDKTKIPTPSAAELAEFRENYRLLKEVEKATRQEERQKKKEEMKKKLEEEKKKQKEEREKEREKKREEKKIHAELMKEWSKPRDDLECDDLKPLPEAKAVRSRIPATLFGDALVVLEFFHNFGPILPEMTEEFPGGVTYRMLEDALIGQDAGGHLADLITFLLRMIFQVQEEEEEEEIEMEREEESGQIIVDLPDQDTVDLTYKKLLQSATVAAQWPQLKYGLPLNKLQLDSFTLTEVLRLHFLSSGAKCNQGNTRFRYQQRGGYTSMDDAGLDFRRLEWNVIKILTEKNVFDLRPGDKVKILTALIGQLLTYASYRDHVEESFEEMKQARSELKQLQWAESKREREEASARHRKRTEDRAKERELAAEKKLQLKKEKEDRLKADEADEAPATDDKVRPDDLQANGDNDSIATEEVMAEADEDGNAKNTKGEGRGRRSRKESDEDSDPEEKVHSVVDEPKLTPDEREALDRKRLEEGARQKAELVEREMELTRRIMDAQHKNAVYPLGRDRVYRRYWTFRSMPGLFIEDDDEDVPAEALLPVEQDPTSNPPTLTDPTIKVTEERGTHSDKENESLDGQPTKSAPPGAKSSPLSKDLNCTNNVAESASVGQTVEGRGEKIVDERGVKTDRDGSKEDIGFPEMDVDLQNDSEGIIPKKNGKWLYLSKPSDLESLLASLNGRGYREGPLKAAILENKSLFLESIAQCPREMFDVPDMPTNDAVIDDRAKVVTLNKRSALVKNGSAQEFLELNLREQLLNLEEQIFAGSLGAIKVENRAVWRSAIEEGRYDRQCTGIAKGGKTAEASPTKSVSSNDSDQDEDVSVSHVVRDLSSALLQIERGVDARYMTSPLGKAVVQTHRGRKEKIKKITNEKEDDEEDDTGKKTALDRWEESLLSCTSIPQLYLHLSALDSSVIWSKSVLHAKCRLCRRKGDAEKMLLCDLCDRGHHMYCLKPPLMAVPDGDWFCQDCRPKQVRQSPRKRRRTFTETSDSSDEATSQEESELTAEESMDSEVELGPRTRIGRLIAQSRRQKGSSSGRSTPESTRSRNRRGSRRSSPAETSHRNSPAETRTRTRSLGSVTRRGGKRTGSRYGTTETRPRSSRKRRAGSSDEDFKPVSATKSRGSGSFQKMKVIEDLLCELTRQDDAELFMTPVSRRQVPDYYDVIKEPMDLSTIRSNINNYRYDLPSEIVEHVRLMLRNCDRYNQPGSAVHKQGTRLSKLFEKRVKDLQLEVTEDKVKRQRRN